MTDSYFKDSRFVSYHPKHLFLWEMAGIVIRIINTYIYTFIIKNRMWFYTYLFLCIN